MAETVRLSTSHQPPVKRLPPPIKEVRSPAFHLPNIAEIESTLSENGAGRAAQAFVTWPIVIHCYQDVQRVSLKRFQTAAALGPGRGSSEHLHF